MSTVLQRSHPVSVAAVLEERARRDPDGGCLRFEGRAIANGELWEAAGRVAGGLAGLGVERGTHVAIMLDNGPRFYETWFGLARLGAVQVPVNTAFLGSSLAHVLADSGATALVVDAVHLPRVAELGALPPTLRTIVVAGDADGDGAGAAAPAGPRVLAFDELDGPPRDAEVAPLDPMAVMYTSGTTGVSKGVVLSHRYYVLTGATNVEHMRLDASDRYLTCLPLFHGMAQLSGTMGPLLAGADIVLERRFSVSRFWEVCREEDVTAFGAIAAMTSMLFAAPASERDRDHAVRAAFAVAVPASIHRRFEERFGVLLVNGYGLTEASMLTYSPYDDRRPGSAGVPLELFEVEVHGPDGRPVPPGTPGEIVCRPRTPGAIMSGYLGRPEATLAAWRDLWLHTGDLGRLDDDGFLWFVDRDKDAIRRRGENISSFEVESEVARHPGVAEVAAYPVPSELGEDEVMLAVVRSDGALDAATLHAHCRATVPRFAVPRYIRFVDELPHTPTAKVRKVELRAEGVTPDTWEAP